jgi:hypothetical protein
VKSEILDLDEGGEDDHSFQMEMLSELAIAGGRKGRVLFVIAFDGCKLYDDG